MPPSRSRSRPILRGMRTFAKRNWWRGIRRSARSSSRRLPAASRRFIRSPGPAWPPPRSRPCQGRACSGCSAAVSIRPIPTRSSFCDPAGSEFNRSLYRHDMTTGESRSSSRRSRDTHSPGPDRANGSPTIPASETAGTAIFTSSSRPIRRRNACSRIWTGRSVPRTGRPTATLSGQRGVQQSEIYLADRRQDRQKRALTPRDGEKSTWIYGRFSADGKTVYAVSDKAGKPVFRRDIANCVWTPVTSEADGIDDFELSPDGTLLARSSIAGPPPSCR